MTAIYQRRVRILERVKVGAIVALIEGAGLLLTVILLHSTPSAPVYVGVPVGSCQLSGPTATVAVAR